MSKSLRFLPLVAFILLGCTKADLRLSGNIIFEDNRFKEFCVERFDKDGDGEISYLEAEGVQEISCRLRGITSLAGIEYFTSLTTLDCCENRLTSLDVSKNTKLTELACGGNLLSSLDISQNTALTVFSCYDNELTSLDVSKNTALTRMNCEWNLMTSLDVSSNVELFQLNCESNPYLTEIWLRTGQKIYWLKYDTDTATVKYKD